MIYVIKASSQTLFEKASGPKLRSTAPVTLLYATHVPIIVNIDNKMATPETAIVTVSQSDREESLLLLLLLELELDSPVLELD